MKECGELSLYLIRIRIQRDRMNTICTTMHSRTCRFAAFHAVPSLHAGFFMLPACCASWLSSPGLLSFPFLASLPAKYSFRTCFNNVLSQQRPAPPLWHASLKSQLLLVWWCDEYIQHAFPHSLHHCLHHTFSMHKAYRDAAVSPVTNIWP